MDLPQKEHLGDLEDEGEGLARIYPVWKKWGTWGEYCLAPEWRECTIKELGLNPNQITIDLFADGKNAARPLFITQSMNAFSFNWSALIEEGEILWANPPFASLENVIAKVCCEPTRMLLCCPEWPEAPWWIMLPPITKSKVFLPEGEELYFGVVKKNILPPPTWRTMVCILDSNGFEGPKPRAVIMQRLETAYEGKGKDALRP